MENDFRDQLTLPLGIRNNNPGNMRPGLKWNGEVGENKGFSVFMDMPHGVRAWIISFYSAVAVHGRTTLREYITAYAPPSENDTENYISTMVAATNINPDEEMPLDLDSLRTIFFAQITHENGAAAGYVQPEHFYAAYNLTSPVHKAFFSQHSTGA